MTIDEQTRLEQITSVPDRSNGKGIFTDRTRLRVIGDLLQDSPYRKVLTGKSFELYARINVLPRDLFLISGHADVVNSIHTKKMHSTYDEILKTLRGNYDNAACNAAMVELMLQDKIPFDNVVFAFTADEETGRCRGAKEVLKALEGHRICTVALDVTYEHHFGCMYSIENVGLRNETLRWIGTGMEEAEQDFVLPAGRYVRLSKKDDFSFLKHSVVSPEHSWMDEGQVYGKQVPAFSFCLPLLGGDMHSDRGCELLPDTYSGYIESLAALSFVLNRQPVPEKITEERTALSRKMASARVEYREEQKEEQGTPINLRNPLLIGGRYQYLCEEAAFYDSEGFDDFLEEISFDFPTEFCPKTEKDMEAMDEEIERAWEATHPMRNTEDKLDDELGMN